MWKSRNDQPILNFVSFHSFKFNNNIPGSVSFSHWDKSSTKQACHLKKGGVFQCWNWDSKLWQPVPLGLLLLRKDTFSEAGTFYAPQSEGSAAKESPQKFWAPQHLYLSWICNWWKLNWTKCSKIRSVRSWNSFWYCIVWCFIISQKKTQSHQFIFFNSGT